MAEANSIPTNKEKRTLECSICLMRFRNPKTLPCLHSYCTDCLVTYAPLGTKTLKCPQCQEQAIVPHGDVTNFKSNFHLRELVQEAEMREQLSRPSAKLLCNCCSEGDELEAVARCLDCDQYLCSSGLAAHKRFSAVRDHVVATLEEIRSGKVRPKSNQNRPLMCIKHPHNTAEIFCSTCEIPICHVCATLNHKSPDHECIEATEATEKRRQQALKGLKQLDEVKMQFISAEIMADKAKQDLTKNALKCNNEIEARCKLLIDRVEIEKAKLLKEVGDNVKEEETKLEQYKISAGANIALIEDVQKQAKITVEEASNGDFLSFYSTVKTKIDQLCLKTPGEYKQMEDMEFKEYVFPEVILGTMSWNTTAESSLNQKSSRQTTNFKPNSLDEMSKRLTQSATAVKQLQEKLAATAEQNVTMVTYNGHKSLPTAVSKHFAEQRLPGKQLCGPLSQKYLKQKCAGKQPQKGVSLNQNSFAGNKLAIKQAGPTKQNFAVQKSPGTKGTCVSQKALGRGYPPSTHRNHSMTTQAWQWPVSHAESAQQNSTAPDMKGTLVSRKAQGRGYPPSTHQNHSMTTQAWQWPVSHKKSAQQNSTVKHQLITKTPIFQTSYSSAQQNSTLEQSQPQTIHYYSCVDSDESDYSDY